jgi:hypothetical protein
MPPCQACGATEVDGNGCCVQCRAYRGASYAVNPPAGDILVEEAGVAAGGPDHHSPFVGYASVPSVPPYASVSSGQPYNAPVSGDPMGRPPVDPAAARPARSALVLPLFLVAVIVTVLVAGTVSVVFIVSRDRADVPLAAAKPPSPSAGPSSPSPAGRPAGACVVGDWTVTSWKMGDADGEVSTTNGGLVALRADGTAEWDFGSGVTFTGELYEVPTTLLVTGKVTFEYKVAGNAFTHSSVQSDARMIMTQGGRVVANELYDWEFDPQEYTCDDAALRFVGEGQYTELRRR